MDKNRAQVWSLTKISICVLLAIAIVWFGAGDRALAQTASKDVLQNQVNAKTEELKQIQQQLQEQQQKLIETQNQKQTLSSEVGKINSNINQINLNIKASQVQIDRLTIQVQILQGQITDAQNDISIKSQAVEELMRQMQQADNENIIMAFLKNKTLSDGVMEAQSLQDLNNNLVISIKELNDAKNRLNNVLADTSNTKEQKRVENTNYQNKKQIASDLKEQKQQFLEETKNKEKNYQESIKQLEKKQTEIALEIEKIEAQLRSEINYKNLPKSIPGLLALPVNTTRVTQTYGSTKFAKSAYRGQWHNGIDLAAPIGTPVVASSDGTVIGTDNQDRYCYKGAYGKYVAIRHYNGLTTLYAHLSLFIVKEGDKVTRGQIIGYVGQTGYATGPHLHFGVYDSETFRIQGSVSCGPKMPYGGDLDPYNYVSLSR